MIALLNGLSPFRVDVCDSNTFLFAPTSRRIDVKHASSDRRLANPDRARKRLFHGFWS